MSSPKRLTRSGSLTSASSLSEIKKMIADSRDFVVSQIADELKEVKDQLSTFSSRINTIEEAIKNVQSDNMSLRTEIASLKFEVNNSEMQIMNASLMEFENRSFRRNNLIIRGLEEKDDGTVEARRQHDEEKVEEVFEEIGITDTVPIECQRIGKKGNGPRMLRVKVGNERKKVSILKKSRNLKHSDTFRGVYINPDLTPIQQEQEKKSRLEVKERRERGENVYLANGRIQTFTDSRNFHRRVL